MGQNPSENITLNRDQETLLLSLAVKKGLLSDENVKEAGGAEDSESGGKRIDWLLKKGHLDPTTLDLLLSSAEFKRESNIPTTQILSADEFLEPAGPPSFPVSNWDRYAFESYLGEGGMGRVFKAFDLRLKRYVALKFVTGTVGGRTYRLVREAQALARIHHDNVCQVYEIGEVQGHLYIAMQYIEGVTLDHVDINRLTLRQKVSIMKEAAEGLHAAHQTGIIHRDIKPANIMVQKNENGSWSPVLMDFGLAREPNDEGITRTGLIVGTPSYMAPEQATMDSEHLDRRTDIYSLGATMYNLFAGRAPFSGTTPLEIIRQVNEKDPEPLRRLNPEIPEDLDRVIMKCLEKQRERRYTTAQELGEDLQRFLSGDAVLARPMSIFHRKFRRLIRSRVAMLLGILLVAIAVIYGIVSMRSRSEIQERLRLANEFSQEIRYIDESMRHALTAPLHDIRKERLVIRERMKEFEKRMNAAGPAGVGPGSYVMGRSYLALHEPEAARGWLKKAIDSNYRVPELDYTLGLALGEIYQKELEEAERIANKELRESRKKELGRLYREPAISLLSSTRNLQMESADYAEALIAFYDRQYPKALEKTSAALTKIPWLYEAQILEGKVYTAQANDERDRGAEDKAMHLLQKADDSYRKAITVGRSDPFAYVGACGVWVNAMSFNLYGSGGDLTPYLKKVQENCDLALQADPDLELAYLEESHSLKLAGEDLINRGQDPTKSLMESEALARKALKLSPRNARAHTQIGMALLNRGRYLFEKGEDPTGLLKQAMTYSRSGISANPNYIYAYNNLGICYLIMADYLTSRTEDPTSSWQEAIQAFQNAIKIRPDYSGAFNNIGYAYLGLSEWNSSHGKDPYPDAVKAVDSYQNAIRMNASEVFSFQNLALAYTDLASYDIDRNRDPELNMRQAIDAHSRAIKLNPGNPTGYANLGVTLLYRAEYDMDHGKNPITDLDMAIKNFEKAVELKPTDFRTMTNRGSAHVDKVLYLQMLGQDTSENLKLAAEWYNKAIQTRPVHGSAWQKLGNVYLMQAEKALEENSNPSNWIRDAEKTFAKAYEFEPDEYELAGVRARLEVAKARDAANQRKNPQRYFEQADKLFAEALKLNPDASDIILEMARRDYYEATWLLASRKDPSDAVQRGLKRIEESRKGTPDSATALLLMGKLQLCKRNLAENAAESFKKALAINSNLHHEADALIQKAHSLTLMDSPIP